MLVEACMSEDNADAAASMEVNCDKLVLEAMGFLEHSPEDMAALAAWGIRPWHIAVADKFIQDLTYGALWDSYWDVIDWADWAFDEEEAWFEICYDDECNEWEEMPLSDIVWMYIENWDYTLDEGAMSEIIWG